MRKQKVAPIIDNWGKLTELERGEAIKNHPRWYQENVDIKVLRQVFFAFAKSTLTKEQYELVRAGTPYVTNLDGALAQVVFVDNYDHAPYIQRLLGKRIPAIIQYVRAEKAKKAELDAVLGRKQPKGEVKVVSIQERIAEQTRWIIGHLEGEIDAFLANGCKKSKFNAKKFFGQHEVKGPQATRILAFLNTNIDELQLVLGRKDDQLTEGFNFLTKPQQKKFYDFLIELRDQTNARIDTVKKTRKPRKKKAKSAHQLTSDVKYLPEVEGGKFKSIDPANIIGARQVWIYDTKTRFLFVYNSDYGLSIKGSTLQDFDPDTSFGKKVREQYLDSVINDVMTGGKVKLRKVLTNINAKEKTGTGRINKNQILLKAIK